MVGKFDKNFSSHENRYEIVQWGVSGATGQDPGFSPTRLEVQILR